MNAKILRIVVILVIMLAVLSWIRSDGRYDFDIRTIVPFMHGSDVTIYDWGGLILIALGVWGFARLGWGEGILPQGRDDNAGSDTWEVIDDIGEEER